MFGDIIVPHSAMKTLRNTCSRFTRCTDIRSLPVVVGLLFVITATMFAFQVYNVKLIAYLQEMQNSDQIRQVSVCAICMKLDNVGVYVRYIWDSRLCTHSITHHLLLGIRSIIIICTFGNTCMFHHPTVSNVSNVSCS